MYIQLHDYIVYAPFMKLAAVVAEMNGMTGYGHGSSLCSYALKLEAYAAVTAYSHVFSDATR